VTRSPSARAPVAVAKVDIAAGLAGLPSRSPAPPLGRSPSARMPAALARLDIGAAALAAAGKAGRRASSDAVAGGLAGVQQGMRAVHSICWAHCLLRSVPLGCRWMLIWACGLYFNLAVAQVVLHVPAVCAGPVEQQLAGMKLQPGPGHSRRQSADRISASVSPEPEATAAPEHHTDTAAGQAFSSSSSQVPSRVRHSSHENEGSSHDATSLLAERAHGLQKTLHTVRMKLAELVRLTCFASSNQQPVCARNGLLHCPLPAGLKPQATNSMQHVGNMSAAHFPGPWELV
jgi:hypothetical protein